MGSHRQLVNAGGLYRHLYALQSVDAEPEVVA
jgi:hypothetical protein